MQVEDGAFVTVQDAVVFAGAVGAPEHDGSVHRARGYILARGIEAGGEDFAGVAWDLSTWASTGSWGERKTGELHYGSLQSTCAWHLGHTDPSAGLLFVIVQHMFEFAVVAQGGRRELTA